ncbi:AAA family ATPase [Ancylobacter mangrovi]|uniref:AAA family ATPase n=1 Tax=Ancylobacter mangrovi TaxID=2972472 RepID=UPI0021627A74|nr:AAA family ATPase [Ancylobacter mangrovi]MCS0501280.1 AAA family ATPase [Ancylobacter mangrovi]
MANTSGGSRTDWGDIEFPPDTVTVPELSVFVLRHFLIVFVAVAIAGAAAFAYVKTATPLYTARAQLLVDPKSSQPTREELQSSAIDAAQIESQLVVLRSERIARAVIEQLGLLDNPAFMKPPGPDVPRPIALQRALGVFSGRLDARRSGFSYVIDLSFSSPDPKLAALVANTTADIYIRDQLESRTLTARAGSDWLESRVAKLREQMNAAALALQEFKAGRSYAAYRPSDAGGDPALDGPAAGQGGADPGAVGQGSAGQLADDRNTLEELESTALAYKKIYESALQGYAEVLQRQSNPLVETRLLTPATIPLDKSHPRSKLILAFGLLLGGVVGVGAAVLRENLDTSIRSVRHANQKLGRLCLGALPRIHRSGSARWSPRHSFDRGLGTLLAGLKRRYGRPSLECFTANEELGGDPFLNALANVSTTLVARARAEAQRTRAIGVTSALAGEGKTTVAGNLACLLAASGVRVLVIDADLQRCAMTAAADVSEQQPGLLQILLEDRRVSECATPVPRTHIELVPTRQFTSAISEALLGSGAMMRCLDEALLSHDLVVVDLPALEQSSGAIAMGPLLDGVLVVVEWGRTPAQLITEAVDRLESTGSAVLGTVLNKAA